MGNVILLLWALAGAALVQILEYYSIRQSSLKYSIGRGVIVTAASGCLALLYYLYVDSALSLPSVILNYAVFLALTIGRLIDTISGLDLNLEEKEQEIKPVYYAAGAVQSGGVLIVSGLWNVYGIACFGALITEFLFIYKSHYSRLKSKRKLINERTIVDWIFSFGIIALSGGVTILHGFTEVSAITVMQLAATGPLAKARF